MAATSNFGDPSDTFTAAALADNPLPDLDVAFSAESSVAVQHVHQYNKLKEEAEEGKLMDASQLPSINDDDEHRKPLLVADQMPPFYSALILAPIAILQSMSEGLGGPALVELLKDRVCTVALNYSNAVCSELNEPVNNHAANEVRSATAKVILYQTLISSLIPVIFSVFAGAWSDRFGRKLPMLLPMIGSTVSNGLIALIGNFHLHPLYFLLPSFVQSLCGGWVILLMAMFSFVGDYSTEKSRGMNIAIVDGCLILFGNVGILIGGILVERVSLIVPYYIITVAKATIVLYILLVIRDRKIRPKDVQTKGKSLISMQNLMDNFRMATRKRVGNTRAHIAIVLGCLLMYSVTNSGDDSVMQLFLEFPPLKWSVGHYSLFSSVQGLVNSCMIMAAVVVLRKYFGTPDAGIAVLASTSAVFAYMGYGLSTHSWQVYVAAGLGCFKTLNIVMIRSLMSGMVDPDEIGKSMSLIASTQAISPMLGGVIFTNLFAATSASWPGLTFVVSAYFMVPVLAAFCFVDIQRRRPEYHVEEPVSFFRADSTDSSVE